MVLIFLFAMQYFLSCLRRVEICLRIFCYIYVTVDAQRPLQWIFVYSFPYLGIEPEPFNINVSSSPAVIMEKMLSCTAHESTTSVFSRETCFSFEYIHMK